VARVVIAAGGTAGHVVPALAIADALRDRGAEVHFVGGQRAEAELVPAAGYPFHAIRVTGFDRRNPLRALRALLRAGRAVVRAWRLLRKLRPGAVVGGGGYVAGPVGLAARMLRIPLLLTEADSHLGVANRILAPFAKRVFLSFPIEGRDGAKYLVSGRPLSANTGKADRAAARKRFGIPDDQQCLLVFGGSLGARTLNEAAFAAFGRAAPCAVLHVCGRRDYPDLKVLYEALGSPSHYHLEEYVQPFADALAAADVVAARAGGSVLELAASGLPAILVPYPYATGDHQTANARWMERAGAAVIVPDSELDGPRLAREVAGLIGSPERLRAMSRAAREVARPDAAERIAAEVLAVASGD
jgi:UDP-N-acetylglucosamine--N-acetylmuramyl-(pentapeptide) pyrophosphoryl-undecaprenol N-acetylglucosamine transferase